MKSSTRVLAIDFDGVIHDFANPIEGRRMGGPIAGAKNALTQLHRRYKIIVFTIWRPESHKTIKDFMKYYELPYDEITNVKPKADYYIDDHGLSFTNWENLLQQL